MNHEYEGYAQDSFKMKRNFTITYGLRYSLYGVPYEKNGVQVVPVTPLSDYFAQRVWAQENGVPNSALPDAKVTYQIGGPVNQWTGLLPARQEALCAAPGSGLFARIRFSAGEDFRQRKRVAGRFRHRLRSLRRRSRSFFAERIARPGQHRRAAGKYQLQQHVPL